jgi:cation diffusion facilitator CzcD-associated flavoprotein CzcO
LAVLSVLSNLGKLFLPLGSIKKGAKGPESPQILVKLQSLNGIFLSQSDKTLSRYPHTLEPDTVSAMGSLGTTFEHETLPPADNNVDISAVAAKYKEEREKRLRIDGLDQYQSVDEGFLSHYSQDTWSKPISRPPVEETVDFLIVGAGYSGMILAVRLIEAGITNIRIIDKSGDFGGTWYWNRYPGAACDIEAYIYMPLLDETGYVPTEKYARGPELFEHSQRIGRTFGLYEKALFQTEVTNLEWDESTKKWKVGTHRGDMIKAQFITTAGGLLHKMKFPGVPGIETFKGHSFHTSRWDFDYTGGDVSGNLYKLANKRIGIIGTGATAIQVVPHLAKWAKQLYVYQRTPSSIDVRLDQPTEPQWAKSLQKGWQQKRMDNFNNLVAGAYVEEDLVADGWTDSLTKIFVNAKMVAETENAADPIAAAKSIQKEMQSANYKKMDQIRKRVDTVVKNPVTAEALKPWYNYLCKRPAFHNAYLPAFNQPNVTLVDTEGRGIDRITENGIVFNGKESELDCIVYATGFEYLSHDYSQRLTLSIRGRNGINLNEHWKDGPRTLHGLHSRHFPNHFIMSVTQSALSPNFQHLLNEQAKHIAFIVAETLRRGATTVETSEESEEEWVRTIIRLGKLREDFLRECTPSYYNDEGKVSEKTLKAGRYGLGAPHFFKLLEDWRNKGTMAGLELDGVPLVPEIASTDENIRVTGAKSVKEKKLDIPENVAGIENLIPAV